MTSKTKYPYFDYLEIVLENEYVAKPYKPLAPVKTGNFIPDFSFSKDFGKWQQYTNGAESHNVIPFSKLRSKPIVIAFYSPHWGKASVDQLTNLNALQHEVKAAGGNLVIITPGKEPVLETLAWDYNLTLNFYFDVQNQLAKQFRIYSESSPVWSLYSGVDENVPLLATYVLNAEKQIVYNHIDIDLNGYLPADEILSAVTKSVYYADERKSA